MTIIDILTGTNTSLENKERFRQLPIYDLLRNIKLEHGNGDIKHLEKCILSNLKTQDYHDDSQSTSDKFQIPLSASNSNTNIDPNNTKGNRTTDSASATIAIEVKDIHSVVPNITVENNTKKSISKEYHPDHNEHENENNTADKMNLSELNLTSATAGHEHSTTTDDVVAIEHEIFIKPRTSSILSDEDKDTLEQIDSMKLCGDMEGD